MFSKFKTALVGSGVLGAAVFAASAAFAGPIGLPNGGMQLQLEGYEAFSATNTLAGIAYNGSESGAAGGEGVFGVFLVSNIRPALGPPTAGATANQQLVASGSPFFNDGSGPQILAVVYGVQNTCLGGSPIAGSGGICQPGGTSSQTNSHEGVVDLYWWNSNNQTAATLAGGGLADRNANGHGPAATLSGYTGASCATNNNAVDNVGGRSGCYFLAQFDLVPQNAFGTDTDNTIYGNNTPSGGGSAFFQAEVDTLAGGLWAAALAQNYFHFSNAAVGVGPGVGAPLTDFSDLNGRDIYEVCASCPGWTGVGDALALHITDPVQMFATNVPEPGTLSLFGTALFGLGWFNRRRNKKQAA